MNIKAVLLLCLVSCAVSQLQPEYLGAPPNPSKPLGVKTLVGSKFLLKGRRYPLSPDQPYRDQARFIGQHGYHSEYLLEALGNGAVHHGHGRGYYRR